MSEQETLTVPQVAEMCGVTPKTVHRWIKAGYFPGAWKGLGKTSPYHIPRDEVETFISQMSQGLREQWEKEHPQVRERRPDTVLAAGQRDQPGQRVILAALAEVLQQFEEGRPGARFALIVEDDADAGSVFEFTLKAAGFNPRVVHSGKAALSVMASMVPDLIVLDLHLPDVPGMEVLRHVRSDPQLAEVPVIVATAHPQMAEDVHDEADLVLMKPIRYKELRNRAVELTAPEDSSPDEEAG
jgi:CheY-like chemotaxis protein/predicted DNA-binding transcriptional regulator AlpA